MDRKAGTVSVIGVYAERTQVHMGIVWIKALTVKTGQANVIGHVDRVLAMLAGGVLDPSPLVTHHMPPRGGRRGATPCTTAARRSRSYGAVSVERGHDRPARAPA